MKPKSRSVWVAIALVFGLLAGCEAANTKLSLSQDPLLLSKKPVEKKPEEAGPVRLVLAEPSVPALPEVALAWNPAAPRPQTGAAEAGTVPGQPRPGILATPVSTPTGPVPAVPASRSAEQAK